MTPFGTVRIRVAALVTQHEEFALIRRVRGGVEQYTVPGGNVDLEAAEPLDEALRRELDEELGLRLKPETELRLLAVQDQMVSRPGPTAPPRKLHLVFHVPVDGEQRAAMAGVEHDELGEGQIVWRSRAEAVGLHLFPAVGPLLAGWDERSPAGSLLLPGLTDANFRWV